MSQIITIKLEPWECDHTILWDEKSNAPFGHDQEMVDKFLAEVQANSGPYEFTTCTDWEYYGMEQEPYVDIHGDECILAAKCKSGEFEIHWVCIY